MNQPMNQPQAEMTEPEADRAVTHIADLVPDPENRREHNPRNIATIVEALHAVGAARSIVIDENDVILAGNGVKDAAQEAGITAVRVVEASGNEIIAVRRRGLSPEQKRHLAIADNRSAELARWSSAQFKTDLAAGLPFAKWFSQQELRTAMTGLAEGGGAGQAAASATLTERFGVPPFSVLDARQGYWQARKEAWLMLGIKSELGRGDNLLERSPAQEDYRAKRGNYKGRTLNAVPGGGSPMPQDRAKNERSRPMDAVASTSRGGRGRGDRAKRKANATPGGSAMPAADYSKNRARGDGRGRAIR